MREDDVMRKSIMLGAALSLAALTAGSATAQLAGVELAPGKAHTAALFKKPSQDLEDDAQIARAGLAALRY